MASHSLFCHGLQMVSVYERARVWYDHSRLTSKMGICAHSACAPREGLVSLPRLRQFFSVGRCLLIDFVFVVCSWFVFYREGVQWANDAQIRFAHGDFFYPFHQTAVWNSRHFIRKLCSNGFVEAADTDYPRCRRFWRCIYDMLLGNSKYNLSAHCYKQSWRHNSFNMLLFCFYLRQA